MPYKNPEDRAAYNQQYYHVDNPTYHRDWKRERRAQDREKYNAYMRAYRYSRKYGLTVEQAQEILARGCEICGTKEGKLCIDHCHTYDEVRGCLCARCNLVVGQMEDSSILLRKAAEYLDKYYGEED